MKTIIELDVDIAYDIHECLEQMLHDLKASKNTPIPEGMEWCEHCFQHEVYELQELITALDFALGKES